MEEIRVWLGTRCRHAMLWKSDLARGIVMAREFVETLGGLCDEITDWRGEVRSRRSGWTLRNGRNLCMGNTISS